MVMVVFPLFFFFNQEQSLIANIYFFHLLQPVKCTDEMLKTITNKTDPSMYFNLFPNWLFINDIH